MKVNNIFLAILLFLLTFTLIPIASAQGTELGSQEAPVDTSATFIDDSDNQFYAGISLGVPCGDLGDASSFAYGAVAGYSFGLSKHISIGPEIDYTHYVGKNFDVGGTTIKGNGFDFVSVSARGDYAFTNRWGIGANVGYGTYLEENAVSEAYFTIGLRWNPIPGITIRPEINIRENDRNEYRVRVQRTF